MWSSKAGPATEQQAVWKKLVENTIEPSETWEIALSAGKDTRENFERLLCVGRPVGLTVLRNLHLMLASGVRSSIASGSMPGAAK